MGGTLDVYQLLNDNERVDVGLYKAFGMDPCTAYECFSTQTLMAGETVDVFFVTLKKLVVPFGGLSEWTFCYMFVAGLTDQVRQLLSVSTSIEAKLIEQLLERAQAIVKD